MLTGTWGFAGYDPTLDAHKSARLLQVHAGVNQTHAQGIKDRKTTRDLDVRRNRSRTEPKSMNYYWQVAYWTKDGNKMIEWVHGTKEEKDVHVETQEQKYGLMMDEVWKYELNDPRVLTGRRGLQVKSADFRDFTQEMYND